MEGESDGASLTGPPEFFLLFLDFLVGAEVGSLVFLFFFRPRVTTALLVSSMMAAFAEKAMKATARTEALKYIISK